ncbi:MAG: hypothetical protein VX951_07820 [Planctomycetota bacterium]|nr:hypothetical protein [Planctomycetota bacterium]
MDGIFRKLTPIVLILLGLSVWFEPQVIPDAGVLRFVVGVLCLYTALLVFERHRMELRFTQVLGSFKQFYSERAAGAGSVDKDKGLEAVRILVAALDSPEAAVRETAEENLKRLTGKDFGSDSAAWTGWLTEAHAGSTGGGAEAS